MYQTYNYAHKRHITRSELLGEVLAGLMVFSLPYVFYVALSII